MLNKSLTPDQSLTLTRIQLDIRELATEQRHIKKGLSQLEHYRANDCNALEKLQRSIYTLKQTDEIKKSLKDSLLKWCTIASILVTLFGGILTYFSYEAGLYQPIPATNQLPIHN